MAGVRRSQVALFTINRNPPAIARSLGGFYFRLGQLRGKLGKVSEIAVSDRFEGKARGVGIGDSRPHPEHRQQHVFFAEIGVLG